MAKLGQPQGQYGDAFLPRWSRAPDVKNRNFGDMFHSNAGLDALHLIAQDTADLISNLKVYNKMQYGKDKEKAQAIDWHPIIDLLNNPCPDNKAIDGYMMHYMTTAYLDMAGEFFWVIERNAQGYPAALYPVIPTWVVQTWSVTFPFFRIMPQGVTSSREVVVPSEDIIWFKNPSLVDPYGRGRGRAGAIADELEADEFAAKAQKNTFYNDGVPRYAISLPDASEEDLENVKETFIQKVVGIFNWRKPFITNSAMSLQKLSENAVELDMVESRKAFRDIFNQHYALPPEMRGILENSNRSTIDSADYLYKKNVLSRFVKRYLQILNSQLVGQFDKTLLLVSDGVVPADEETARTWALKEFQAGILTLNEYNQKIGHAAIANGDYYLRPNGLTMVPATEAMVKPVTPTPPITPAPEPTKAGKKSFSEDVKTKHWNDFDTKAKNAEKGFIETVKKISGIQEAKFKKSFFGALDRNIEIEKAFESAIISTFNGKMDVETFNLMAPDWVKALKEGGTLAQGLLKTTINFDLMNPVFSSWVKDHGLEQAKEINGTTREYLARLKEPIADAVKKGESIDKISAKLQKEFDKLSSTRADLIARTETMSSVNFGQFAVYDSDGVEEIEWLASTDKSVRDSHKISGEKVKMGEKFSNGLLFPGDSQNGAAKDVCNCRCTILPVIKLEE